MVGSRSKEKTPPINVTSGKKPLSKLTPRKRKRSSSSAESSDDDDEEVPLPENGLNIEEKLSPSVLKNNLLSEDVKPILNNKTVGSRGREKTPLKNITSVKKPLSKLKSQKRKRSSSSTESSDNDDEEVPLPENCLEVEEKLTVSALKNNLSSDDVKTILKKVVTNEHVLAMVKLKEEELDIGNGGDVPGPKLTRAKAKELQKIPWSIPLTPVKNRPSAAVTALIVQELPEEESDDEYEPNLDDHEDSDEGETSEFNSDLDSLPKTPATPGNSHIPECPDSPIKPKLWSDDGLFRIPVVALTQLSPKMLAPGTKFIEEDEEATIARRTRSKFSLNDTPIEELQKSFVPPDIYQDMLDDFQESAPIDDVWRDFLQEFMKPLPQSHEEDDEADPEYNHQEDNQILKEDEDEDNARAMVSRKELNDLVAELFDDIDIPLFLPMAENDKTIEEVTETADPNPDLNSSADTLEILDLDMHNKNQVTLEAHQVAIKTFKLENLDDYPQDDDEAAMITYNTAEKTGEIVPKIEVIIKSEEPNLVYGQIPLSRPHISETEPKPALCPPYIIVGAAEFSPGQIAILQQQMRIHIQLATQTFIQVYGHPYYWKFGPRHKEMITNLHKLANGKPESVFNVTNLEPAFRVCELWEKNLSEDTEENTKLLEFVKNECEESRRWLRTIHQKYNQKFPWQMIELFGTFPAFPYPHLLPLVPFRTDTERAKGNTTRKTNFLPSEDHYLSLAIQQFYDQQKVHEKYSLKSRKFHRGLSLKRLCELIEQNMMPFVTSNTLIYHIGSRRCGKGEKDNGEINPIKYYYMNNKVLPTNHDILPYSKEALKYQPRDCLPLPWKKYFGDGNLCYEDYKRIIDKRDRRKRTLLRNRNNKSKSRLNINDDSDEEELLDADENVETVPPPKPPTVFTCYEQNGVFITISEAGTTPVVNKSLNVSSSEIRQDLLADFAPFKLNNNAVNVLSSEIVQSSLANSTPITTPFVNNTVYIPKNAAASPASNSVAKPSVPRIRIAPEFRKTSSLPIPISAAAPPLIRIAPDFSKALFLPVSAPSTNANTNPTPPLIPITSEFSTAPIIYLTNFLQNQTPVPSTPTLPLIRTLPVCKPTIPQSVPAPNLTTLPVCIPAIPNPVSTFAFPALAIDPLKSSHRCKCVCDCVAPNKAILRGQTFLTQYFKKKPERCKSPDPNATSAAPPEPNQRSRNSSSDHELCIDEEAPPAKPARDLLLVNTDPLSHLAVSLAELIDCCKEQFEVRNRSAFGIVNNLLTRELKYLDEMLPSMPFLSTNDNSLHDSEKLMPPNMQGPNIISSTPIRSVNHTAKERQPKNNIVLSLESNSNNINDRLFATAYFQKVLTRLNKCTNDGSDSYKFIEFQSILDSFDPGNETPADLYRKIKRFFGKENSDLTDEFLAFLTASQAAEVGRFMDHFALMSMEDFIQKLHTYFARKPTILRKIIRNLQQALTLLEGNKCKPEETKAELERFKAAIIPHLRGTPLMEIFLKLLPEERPPESASGAGSWEVFPENLWLGDSTNEGAEVVEGGNSDVRRSYCTCIQTHGMNRRRSRKHCCIACGMTYLQGHVFIQHGRLLKPGRIVFCNSSLTPEQHASRLSGRPYIAPAPSNQSDDEQVSPKRSMKSAKTPSSKSKLQKAKHSKAQTPEARRAAESAAEPREAGKRPACSKTLLRAAEEASPPARGAEAPPAAGSPPGAKEEASEGSWARDEDKTILQVLQFDGATEHTYTKINELIPHRSRREIKERFSELMLVLQHLAATQ